MHFFWDSIRHSFHITSYMFMFIALGETAWGPSSFSPAVSANTNVCYFFLSWKQTWNENGLSAVPLAFTFVYSLLIPTHTGWSGKIRGWFQLKVVNRIKGLCGVVAKSSGLVTGHLLVRGLNWISNELVPLSKLLQVLSSAPVCHNSQFGAL